MGQFVQLPDGTHAAQISLTGSYVKEEIVATGVTVTAGVRSTVGGVIDLSKTEKFSLSVKSTVAHAFDVLIQSLTSDGATADQNKLIVTTTGVSVISHDPVPVRTSKANARVENKDTVDRSYDVRIYKQGVMVK